MPGATREAACPEKRYNKKAGPLLRSDRTVNGTVGTVPSVPLLALMLFFEMKPDTAKNRNHEGRRKGSKKSD